VAAARLQLVFEDKVCTCVVKLRYVMYVRFCHFDHFYEVYNENCLPILQQLQKFKTQNLQIPIG